MELPEPPDWREAARADTVEEWVARHFVPVDLANLVACLDCASLVVPGEQMRHWSSLHKPRF
jgi:hypothetical protein